LSPADKAIEDAKEDAGKKEEEAKKTASKAPADEDDSKKADCKDKL